MGGFFENRHTFTAWFLLCAHLRLGALACSCTCSNSCENLHTPNNETAEESAHLRNPATRAPNPMAKWSIDQQGPQGQHDRICAEAHSLHQRARDDCGCDDGKGHLESCKAKARKPRVTPHLHVQICPQAVVKVTHEHPEASGPIVSEGPRKSKNHPSEAHDGHGSHTHHHSVDYIRIAHQATIEEAEPSGHQEHQGCRGQNPCNCTGVHGIFGQSRISHG